MIKHVEIANWYSDMVREEWVRPGLSIDTIVREHVRHPGKGNLNQAVQRVSLICQSLDFLDNHEIFAPPADYPGECEVIGIIYREKGENENGTTSTAN